MGNKSSKKLPDPYFKTIRFQPLYHKPLIDYIKTLDRAHKLDSSEIDPSQFIRACIMMGIDRPDILGDYLKRDKEPSPQISLEELMTG